MSTQLYTQQFKDLTQKFHSYVDYKKVRNNFDNSLIPHYDHMSHDEMVFQSLLEYLEENYNHLSKEERDGVILMIMENDLLE